VDKNRPVEFIFAIKVYLSLDGKCLGFRRHLRAVYPARFLPVIREKVRLTTTVSLTEKRTKPSRGSNRDGSCFGQSQISKRRQFEFRKKEREREERALRYTYFASNYNVTCRREEDTRRCGPTIYRGRHIAEIFSHRIWLVWEDGGGGEVLREIRL